MTIKMRFTLTVEVDEDVYERTYGVPAGKAASGDRAFFRRDVRDYCEQLVAEGAASDSGIQSAKLSNP